MVLVALLGLTLLFRSRFPGCSRRSTNTASTGPKRLQRVITAGGEVEMRSSPSSLALRTENEEPRKNLEEYRRKMNKDRTTPPDLTPPLPTSVESPPGLTSAISGAGSGSSDSPPLAPAPVDPCQQGNQHKGFIRDDALNAWIGTAIFAMGGTQDSSGYGIIIGADNQLAEVQIAGTSSPVLLTWDQISWDPLATSYESIQGESPFVAPVAGAMVDRKKGQARRLRAALHEARAHKALDEAWPAIFWRAVAMEKSCHGLEQPVQSALEAGGYHGDNTLGPPKDSLDAELLKLVDLGGFTPGVGPGPSLDIPSATSSFAGHSIPVHQRLPADLQRAAPETYRSIRREGVASMRQWILDQYPVSARQGAEFNHLFQACCQADFLLAPAKNEAELMSLLNGSDVLEIIFRDLGAFIYERRTGDRIGGAHLRALRVPGANTDILPDWLIKEGTLHTTTELKRAGLVKSGNRSSKGDGKGDGKQKKGKGKKNASAKGGKGE